MTHEEKSHSIVNEWHIRHYEEPLKDAKYIEGAMYQALIDNVSEALASAEKNGYEKRLKDGKINEIWDSEIKEVRRYRDGWNEAIEAAVKVAEKTADACHRAEFGEGVRLSYEISESINKLKRG